MIAPPNQPTSFAVGGDHGFSMNQELIEEPY